MDNSNNKNILFSQESRKVLVGEYITKEHTLAYSVSGTLELKTNTQQIVSQPGEIFIVRRNELTKSIKFPEKDGRPFKCVNILLTQDILRSYATQNNIGKQEKYSGSTVVDLSKNKFVKGYFESLVPYFDQPEKMTSRIAFLKSQEAIELLLNSNQDLDKFLFDTSEPHKIDMEHFMIDNYHFNIPLVEFARLTGRSLSTFQRDFKTTFKTTPEKWLQNKRLVEAKYLIDEKKQKPSEVYHHVGFENFSHFSQAFKQKFGYNASAGKASK